MKVRLVKLRCSRCGHTWTPRKPVVYVCPKCHSPKWAEPKGGR
jgi:Zn finger protein HypA/HybF involved in hydrogenase expression